MHAPQGNMLSRGIMESAVFPTVSAVLPVVSAILDVVSVTFYVASAALPKEPSAPAVLPIPIAFITGARDSAALPAWPAIEPTVPATEPTVPAISLTVPAIGAAILPSFLAAPETALIGAVKGVANRPRKLFFGGAGFGGSGFGSGFGGSVG